MNMLGWSQIWQVSAARWPKKGGVTGDSILARLRARDLYHYALNSFHYRHDFREWKRRSPRRCTPKPGNAARFGNRGGLPNCPQTGLVAEVPQSPLFKPAAAIRDPPTQDHQWQ